MFGVGIRVYRGQESQRCPFLTRSGAFYCVSAGNLPATHSVQILIYLLCNILFTEASFDLCTFHLIFLSIYFSPILFNHVIFLRLSTSLQVQVQDNSRHGYRRNDESKRKEVGPTQSERENSGRHARERERERTHGSRGACQAAGGCDSRGFPREADTE